MYLFIIDSEQGKWSIECGSANVGEMWGCGYPVIETSQRLCCSEQIESSLMAFTTV